MDKGRIIEQVHKLLSLAGSENENEARLALLRARELMAKHKLSNRDLEDAKPADEKLIHEHIGVTCTSRKNAWRRTLAALIAKSYLCSTYITWYGKRSQTYTVGLAGLETDFQICKKAILYAVDCVDSYNKRLASRYKGIYTQAYISKLQDNYGAGFCNGLRDAFNRQNEEKKQEWGLVMVQPQAVTDFVESLGEAKRTVKLPSAADSMLMAQRRRGYSDGEQYVTQKRLEEKESNLGIQA